jgi:hypothetical protein
LRRPHGQSPHGLYTGTASGASAGRFINPETIISVDLLPADPAD